MGACGIKLNVVEVDSESRVQILNVDGCIWHYTNTLDEGMSSTIYSPAVDR